MRADDLRHVSAYRRFVLSMAAGAVVLGVAGQGTGHAAQTPVPTEGCAIVARHKAVFPKMPHGLSPFSTDAVLLGNGDVGLSISTTPLEKGSPVKKQDPGKIRFWFHKNDMWELGGPTTARLVAVMDATIGFDPAKPEPRCRVETDLLTATTVGTLAQEGGVSVAFRAWVSAVDNMVFLEFVSENGTIPCQFDLQVM